MFLLIFEDGTIKKKPYVTNGECLEADDGILPRFAV